MSNIIGIDEVGRGSVAGPVVVAGIKFSTAYPLFTHKTDSTDSRWIGLNEVWQKIRDSKKLPRKAREEISNLLLESGWEHFMLYADSSTIDRFGIGACLSHMILMGIFLLTPDIDYFQTQVIIDGKIKILDKLNLNLLKNLTIQNARYFPKTESLETLEFKILIRSKKFEIKRENKADDRYLSIAAASNLAKVDRDRFMTKISIQFPEYNWHQNKGYGTKEHLDAIQKYGKNIMLRQSFLTKYL